MTINADVVRVCVKPNVVVLNPFTTRFASGVALCVNAGHVVNGVGHVGKVILVKLKHRSVRGPNNGVASSRCVNFFDGLFTEEWCGKHSEHITEFNAMLFIVMANDNVLYVFCVVDPRALTPLPIESDSCSVIVVDAFGYGSEEVIPFFFVLSITRVDWIADEPLLSCIMDCLGECFAYVVG